jgi:tetratricopeptide (TPR) repeat protein
MRKTIAIAALAAALNCISLPLAAATPSEFYSSLLRRGVAAYDSGRFEEAAQHLRYAAFGYVDSIEAYQTAQIYLALAHDRLNEQDRVREAARRVLVAERIERRYARVTVPPAVRTAFEKVAARVLTSAELAALRGTGELPPAPPVQSPLRTTTTGTATQPVQPPPVRSTTTTASTTPPVTVDRVEVEVTKPAQTQPQTSQQPAATRNTTAQPTQTQASSTSTQQPRPATTQPVQTPQGTQRGTNNNASNATPAQPRPATTAPVTAQPRLPAATPATTRPTYTASEAATRFANAERALTTSNLAEARRIYRELLASANAADHATAVRIAEGFYRARDFAGALASFERAGTLRRGEEPYRYYVAVALYETGQYERARRELAAALPYIEVTADVERYRLKIQSANQ